MLYVQAGGGLGCGGDGELVVSVIGVVRTVVAAVVMTGAVVVKA